ncbi:Glycoside Hydrolase Family 47 protein [Gigaspora rosea]|uniref:alpha-1,2-Mannosidase n=1 Tax=Gigaspora rosea TaxID=44941 RepID=A0A397UXB5_9GLOM|nr:Glycoside Hydrolase Family 47 protein [Gigaspora rosea]
MFYHGFNKYMNHAFPKDELNPLKCSGRGSDKTNPNNIIINDVLGDYSLTLIDSLDSFVVFNDKAGFESAIRNVIKHVSFNVNSKVQVFEANIRVLGGLLSGHLFATDPRFGFKIDGYNNELLELAYDLGQRLLPAFQNSKTGIPYPRVNLRYGVPKSETRETCTAGAGTLILEFGVLSRLMNDTKFENVARRALFSIWNRRTDLDLVGNVIDIQTGQWIHTAASTGAGIDSFYEYLLKAYVLFGESEYLHIFNEAYSAVLRYIRDETGYLYRNVNILNGGLMSAWVDSLSAYFPGLQVLAGDLDNAIKSHLFYYNIWRKYRALPERFNFHLRNVEIASYPLRPEFIESTYFLYRATKDPFYLHVGEMVLEDLQSYARVECGFASVKDVLTKKLEGRMESFALSETFKYLYLLFDTENVFNKLDDNFVFTTEAHIFPLTAQYWKKTWKHKDNFTCSAYKNPKKLASSILERPDADIARELVGFEELSLPFLDPYGYCEAPQADPLILDVSYGEAPDSDGQLVIHVQYR